MTGRVADRALDWNRVAAVVFDMDGTLYDQAPLRAKMVPRLCLHALGRFDPKLLRIVSALRRERERLADAECTGFEDVLIAAVAAQVGMSPDRVRAVMVEWLETRPLPFLASCMVPGTAALFTALARSGRRIAVLSDYPATRKLAALGLSADLVLSANDPEIDVQKPNPKALAVAADRFGLVPEALLMIGDRDDRDGEAARRVGAACLIRKRDFHTFTDPIFAAMVTGSAVPSTAPTVCQSA